MSLTEDRVREIVREELAACAKRRDRAAWWSTLEGNAVLSGNPEELDRIRRERDMESTAGLIPQVPCVVVTDLPDGKA